MKSYFVLGVLLTVPLVACSEGEKFVGNNPHPITSPEWTRYMNCQLVSDFAKEYSGDKVMHEMASMEEKRERGLSILGKRSIIDEQTVQSLTAKKALETSIAMQKQPEKAFQATWEYCMTFSTKQHYYFDANLEDIPSLDAP